ncbi:hypothetical protein DPMN_095806 [Dreissena polymorpha]|uniref:acylphosphatase n=2 Tax=Dreissena polymorpha TaxID=45954 RepID=A0A9D4L8L4_DREPO|nr:hypothetical protein DPMN_095806 [Dreissena polymorpha]
MASGSRVTSVNFEIFGKVQGVFFRKHTEKTAKGLGLVGWVMNTPQKTVQGQVQGREEKVAEMKKWLQTKGSPKSKIEKAVFTEERAIPALTYKSFSIKE